MATFGPVQIAVDTDDGAEFDDATWQVQGTDIDGNRVGNAIGSIFDMGMRWDNVTIPNGATITSATIELFMKFNSGAGDIVTRMQGFDEDDTATFGVSARPSQRTQTTALVDRTYTNAGDWVDETYLALDDVTAIVQEIVDRGGWVSGNAIGFVLKDNGSAANERWQFQDYGRSAGDAAKLTIIYAAGATITSVPASVARGETGAIIGISGASASQGAATVTYGGESCTITTYPGTSGNLLITIPDSIALQHDTTGYSFVYTDDDTSSDTSAAVPFNEPAGWDYTDLVNPVTTEGSILFGYTGDVPVTGDQAVYTTPTDPDSITFTVGADGEWILDSVPTANQTVSVYVIQADGTIGDTGIIIYSVGGAPAGGMNASLGKLLRRVLH